VIQELKELYPSIKDSNILRHSDIAPDRKNDPGEHFSLDRIK
jgi:N-acetyl-anhydromuramyl-L-alanine amidase AmpD